MLLAIAAIAIGLECLLIFQPWNDIAVDFDRVIAAGQLWRSGGDPYRLTGYLYSPAMTAVASLIPPGTWAIWAAIELALVLTFAPRTWWGLLIAITWPGVWLDLALGNVTIALTAAGLVALRSDRIRSGLLFGAVLALAPKPMFVLLLVWMVIHRRRSLEGVVISGLLITAFGFVVAGATSYVGFFKALAAGVDSHFVGNYGLSYISPVLGVAAFGAVALVALWLIRRPADGLMAAAIAGTFAGTYVGLYSTILPLAILPSFAGTRPVAAVRVAMAGLLAPFTLWVSGLIAIVFVAWRSGNEAQVETGRPGSESDLSIEPGS